jgi:uncharacterized membrane protein
VSDYAYHTFAHQLVLGLAVPENAFAKREGIEWNDMVGLAIAKKVMPNVGYLGAGYETALFTFYRGLWRDHPGEMAGVYLGKLRSDGDEVFLSAAGIARQYFVPLIVGETLHKITNGIVIALLVLVFFVASVWMAIRRGAARWLIVACVSLGAMVALLEGFLTYSIFVGIYYSSLLYFVFFASLVLLQWTVDGVARLAFPNFIRNDS